MITQPTPPTSPLPLWQHRCSERLGLVIECHSQSVSECQSAFIQKMPDSTLIIFSYSISISSYLGYLKFWRQAIENLDLQDDSYHCCEMCVYCDFVKYKSLNIAGFTEACNCVQHYCTETWWSDWKYEWLRWPRYCYFEVLVSAFFHHVFKSTL